MEDWENLSGLSSEVVPVSVPARDGDCVTAPLFQSSAPPSDDLPGASYLHRIFVASFVDKVHDKALMRRQVNRSVVTDTAFLFPVRSALIRTRNGSAFDPVHVRIRRGVLLSRERTFCRVKRRLWFELCLAVTRTERQGTAKAGCLSHRLRLASCNTRRSLQVSLLGCFVLSHRPAVARVVRLAGLPEMVQ